LNFRKASALLIGVALGLAVVALVQFWPERTAPEEARLCRLTLPALNVGARLELQPPRPGPFPGSLRIDYRAVDADGRQRQRFVICRFGPAPTGAMRSGGRNLTGLATEFGPMADASFYFLRRFYLDRRDPPPTDPAPP
jgi:branched-chain amino acid transport system permease protein